MAPGVQQVLVERVRWPVLLNPKRPGGCDDLAPAEIRVREGGEERQVTDVFGERGPTTHVLLVDTSGSMGPLIREVRRTAGIYIEGLPRHDRVLVASFDQDTRLHGAPGLERVDPADALGALRVGLATALWDAVHDLVSYLRNTSGRKVLVLLTDGCNTLSEPRHTVQRVLAEAESVPSLTVIPVVVGDATRCPPGSRLDSGTPAPPRNALESLARRTGGKLLGATRYLNLAPAFRDIRERLRAEGRIIYKGSPATAGGDGKRVTIRSRRRGCSVHSAGPRFRIARPAMDPGEGLKMVRRMDDAWMELRGEDLLLERGDLYESHDDWVVVDDRRPLREERLLRMRVPPLERLATPGSPGALARALIEELGAEGCEAERHTGESSLLHGRAFFDHREAIGLALAEVDDYREWAVARMRARRRSELQDLAGGDRARVEALLDQLPPLPHPERLLAEWLGDVTALELAEDLERLALAGAPELRDLVRERWSCLGQWFAPPTGRRVVVPLLPVRSADTNHVGFYRIHRPVPFRQRRPPDALPDAPRFIEFLHALEEELPRPLEIRYVPASNEDLRRYMRWPESVAVVPAHIFRGLRQGIALLADGTVLNILFVEGVEGMTCGWTGSQSQGNATGGVRRILGHAGLECGDPHS